MKIKIATIASLILLVTISNIVFGQKTTTTTSTTTVNGKTVTSTATSHSGNAIAHAFSTTTDDSSSWWKYREITKDFPIGKTTPIFVESSNRDIEIKTWDQPTVRIVAKARYKNDKDINESFDEIFERSGIKIKNEEESFEILGANSKGFSYSVKSTYTDDSAPGAVSISGSNFSSSSPSGLNLNGIGSTNGLTSLENSNNKRKTIIINSPSYFHSDNGDTVMFNNDSNATNLKIYLQSDDENKKMDKVERLRLKAEKNKEVAEANKKIAEKNKTKIEGLSKQLQGLSQKLAKLSLEDDEKNSKEIGKINQEISKIANQIAFQSLNNANQSFKMSSDFPLTLNFGVSDDKQAFMPNIKVQNLSLKPSALKWTVYIPKNHKISIDSKYGNINLSDDIQNAKIISKYGNVETKNVGDLTISNEYGNVFTEDINNGDIEIRSGKLKTRNVENIEIDSKNANIDMEKVGNIKINSSNDDYDISSINQLSANKNYGSLRLTTLNGKLELKGVNADLKIRNITPSVKNIDITNKFAKIALPFSDLNNYSVVVNGSFNSSFDDFTKKENGQKGFSANHGNGKDLSTTINCNNCQLDFK